jgi:hypothetical protein
MVLSGGAPAQAAETRNLLRTFGAASSTVPDPAPLSNPQGAAVDEETEAIYIADTGNSRVEEFSASGHFLLAFGGDVNANALALHPDVCTNLETCQAGTPGSKPGEFTSPQFIAVDNDPASPSFHDIYIADTGNGIVSKFTPAGELVESWGTKGQLNGSTTPATTFGAIAGIAVGSTGTLYVFNENNQVFEFKPSSSFVSEVGLERGVSLVGFAVNDAGDLFKVSGGAAIMEFAPGGGLMRFITNEQTASGPITLDSNGELYFVGQEGTLGHYGFNGGGEVLEPGGGPCTESCAPSDSAPVGFVGSGIAAATGSGDSYLSNAAEGEVYQLAPLVTVTTQAPSEVKARTVQLNGTVNPGVLPLTECEFEYIEAAKYDPSAAHPYEGGGTAACVPAAALIPTATETTVSAEVTGLTPGVVYHFQLRVNNKDGASAGGDEHFETQPRPVIDSATVSSLTGSSAVLNAKIKPEFSAATYYFEYDTMPYQLGEAAHGTRVPTLETEDKTLPAGQSDVPVSAAISGLSVEHPTYYWRVVASNESGTTTSVQHSFVYDTTGEGLPDGRAYEMVTPPHKNGADLAVFSIPPEFAPDGSRVIASALQCFDSSESCNSVIAGSLGAQYAFTRTPAGWVTSALAPSAAVFSRYAAWAYDAGSGAALFSMPTPPSLGGKGEDDFYLREPASGAFAHIGPDTPPALGPLAPEGGSQSDQKQAYTADFSHFAWEMGAGTAFEPGTGSETVYEYAGGGHSSPLLVGVSGGEGSTSMISECETRLGGTQGSPEGFRPYPGSMSEDGRTVFFTAYECGGAVRADTVFARVDGELADAHTVAISDPSPSECGSGVGAGEVSCRAAGGQPANAEFVGASADGGKAFFLSPQQLTDEASEDADHVGATGGQSEEHACAVVVGGTGCNLYEYDFANPEGASLVDVSAGDSSGEGPRVQGVLAFSPDGSHVYFVAKGVLSTAANDLGQVAENGADNLYMFERDAAFPAGRTVFITDLAPNDETEWHKQSGEPANVTPDGGFLVFLSHGDLTADDTSASGARQVFRYDAGTGVLNRVSVGNDGYNDDGNRSAATPCTLANGCVEDAQIVPAIEGERSDPSMSDDGARVFFDSPVGLTAHALDDVLIGEVNGRLVYAQNVYEWEQEGVGSCPAGRAAGCVFLISDGRDTNLNIHNYGALCEKYSTVCLLGTDTEGRNVLFATADQLVKADTNTEIDFYDARVCEPEDPCVSEPPPALPACAGEECHGIPPARSPVTAGPTATFNGAGNLTPALTPAVTTKVTKKTVKCKRGFVKKKVKKKETCVKRKSKTKAKKTNRRAK